MRQFLIITGITILTLLAIRRLLPKSSSAAVAKAKDLSEKGKSKISSTKDYLDQKIKDADEAIASRLS